MKIIIAMLTALIIGGTGWFISTRVSPTDEVIPLNGVVTKTIDVTLETNGGYGTDYVDIRCYKNFKGKELLCVDIYNGKILFED